MNTMNMLKALADAVDVKRSTATASRDANITIRATSVNAPNIDAVWAYTRAANAAANKAQKTLDDVLASVRAHLASN